MLSINLISRKNTTAVRNIVVPSCSATLPTPVPVVENSYGRSIILNPLDRPKHVLWRGSVGKQFTPAIQDLLNNLHVEDETRTQNTFEMGAVTRGYLNELRDPLSRI